MNELTQQHIETERGNATSAIEMYQRRLDLLNLFEAKLAEFPKPLGISFGYKCIDFDGLDRETALELVSFLALGKWDKELVGDTSINYISEAEFLGHKVRLYAVPPPDTCKLIEVDVEIPAVPARIERRFKLVCKQGETETEDIAGVTTV